jgi:hypothetical protein
MNPDDELAEFPRGERLTPQALHLNVFDLLIRDFSLSSSGGYNARGIERHGLTIIEIEDKQQMFSFILTLYKWNLRSS